MVNRVVRQKLRQTRRRRPRNIMPIARPVAFDRNMSNIRINKTSARVSGADLVYTVPDTLPITADAVTIAVIPSNPAYWLGTKISQVARGYQNYRPIKFNVHYVPHCAATQAGNVIAGTIFHEAPPTDNLQQSLRSSNGGIMTQVFKPATSVVKVGNNLQKNLYRVGGNIDDDSMPFYYIAIAIACKDSNNNRINPGYFYVDYTYTFKNPIGGGIEFANSGITKFNDQLTTMKKGNISLILCEPKVGSNMTLGVGTMLDCEWSTESSGWKFYYNGTEVDAPNTYVWVFSNQQSNANTQEQMRAYTKTAINYDNELQTVSGQATIPANAAVMFQPDIDVIATLVNVTQSPIVMGIPTPNYYVTADIEQNFGNYMAGEPLGSYLPFTAAVADYYLRKFVFNTLTARANHYYKGMHFEADTLQTISNIKPWGATVYKLLPDTLKTVDEGRKQYEMLIGKMQKLTISTKQHVIPLEEDKKDDEEPSFYDEEEKEH